MDTRVEDLAVGGGGERRLRGFVGCVNTAGPGVERAPYPVVSRVRGTWKPRRGPGFRAW